MLSHRLWTHRIPHAPIRFRIRCYSSNSHGLTPDQPVQSYISRSPDPYLNLSIEHYLLQKSSPKSTILFLYINRPSIIIGRNQNPWTEINMPLLAGDSSSLQKLEGEGLEHVDLVRRRSGGGTVFHDRGNVNWSVICPSEHFTRDLHAEMVTRALRKCGVQRARVNERHDIVLDQGTNTSFTGTWTADNDTHSTPYHSATERPLKISGSAYKLTRGRALHHGTALLESPNLGSIPKFLRSEVKGFIRGRGVDSVSSPVGNVGLATERFVKAVQEEFRLLYGGGEGREVGESFIDIDELNEGRRGMQSAEWFYNQTPQFTFSDLPVSKEDEEMDYTKAKIRLDVRHGAVQDCNFNIESLTESQREKVAKKLVGTELNNGYNWEDVVDEVEPENEELRELLRWAQKKLQVPQK